ncbi:hypothetical protein AB4232_21685 [Vibrio sp. 10N.286.46.A8]|uniref:hypothetical protein n=1 Tax=Vibrio sp. 10N.286.46.A8 TaxID=3229697 RepID=UPI0035512549
MRVVVVLLTVILTFITSVILSVAASKVELISFYGGLVVAIVVLINVVKFSIWGWLNNRYDLSKTYPLTAMFFPLIFIYAILIGDTDITVNKLFGLFVILLGLLWMEVRKMKC